MVFPIKEQNVYSRFKTVASFLLCLTTTVAVKGPPKCQGLREKGVKHFDVRLMKSQVPGQMTTYVCQNKPLPVSDNQVYHAIAFEPLVENKNLVHHMLMFGCGETYDTPSQLAQARTPHVCGAADNKCRFFLVQWSMGMDGQICSPPDTGVRFGFKSFKSLALQIHWNNAQVTEGLADSSGFRVYYTKKLRKYDIGNLQVGQNDLEIPPGIAHYPQTGSCSSECTSQWLKQPTFLTRAHIHMHYIGEGGVLELVRNGQVVQEIVREMTYNYKRPLAHVFQEPVKVLPGDEVRLTCFFNTRDGEKMRNRTVYFGEGSDGEMCYAFITYYPNIDGFNQCIQFEHYDICSETGFAPFGECIFEGFIHSFESGMARAILDQCGTQENGSGNDDRQGLCSEGCADAIREVTEHPCMQDRLGKQARRVFLPRTAVWADVSRVMADASRVMADAETRCRKR